jgi:flavorubredoxin
MKITRDIKYVGVNDHNVDLFEGQYVVPNGMAYNSYIVLDDKIAVFDTVDQNFGEEWLNNVKTVLGEREPDYLIIQHMEPDHSANINLFMNEYKNAVIVASSKAFEYMKSFYENDYAERRIIVFDKDVLSLGKHNLTFFTAPMVHWPEVIVTYDSFDKVLFSADGFGKFGALDADEDWACEARRYYFGIVGKYGVQVQALLKKLSGAELNGILPLHGPVLLDNLSYYLNLYNVWSSYDIESDGVAIFYTSVYGNTKKAVLKLVDKLNELGAPKVSVTDLARSDMAEAVEDAFRYGKIVLATTTYNGELFPFMREFINELTERGYKNRTIGIIENGTWAPTVIKKINGAFQNSKNITILPTSVSIKSALSEENLVEIENLAKEIIE